MFFCFLSPIIYLICKALGKIIVKKVIFLSSFLPTDIIGVVVITTAQLHSTKPEFRFCAGSNPARGVSEICDGEDLWQWSRLEIRLNGFRRLTIPQKQFIITIIIIIIIIILIFPMSSLNKLAMLIGVKTKNDLVHIFQYTCF